MDKQGDSPRLARGLLATAIVLGPHLLAGVQAWSTAAMAAMAALSWWLSHRAGRALSLDAVEKCLLAALTIAILHACPLPLAVAQLLAPEAVNNAFATAKGLGQPSPAWIPFTMDSGGTYERIVFGVVVLAGYAASRRIASLVGARWVLMCVAFSVCLVACSTLVHKGLNLDAVYGVYTPVATHPIGPLLNPNVLAGFMAFGLPVVLSHAVVAERRWIRGSWAVAAVGVAVTLLLAGSRGGLVAACIAVISFPVAIWLSTSRGGTGRHANGERTQALAHRALRRETVFAGGLAFVVCLAGIAVERIAPDAIDADFENLSKFVLFQQEIEFLLGDFHRTLLGVGRGAFSASFASSLQWPRRATHAECFPLQFAIEFGIPLTVAFIVVLVAKSIAAFRARLDPMRMGALLGCVVIAAHNLVDYGLELSGIAVVVAAAAGTAFSKRRLRGGVEPTRGASPHSVRLRSVPAVVCLLVVVWAGPKAVASELFPSEQALGTMLEQREYAEFTSHLRKILSEHTGEPSLAVLAGAHAVMTDDKRMAAFWLNRAMLLAQGWAAPHLWAARWLATLGRWDQAGLELQTAAELDVISTRKMLCSWLEWLPSANLLLSGLPADGGHRVTLLDAAARCLRHAPAEAARLDAVLLAEQPMHWNARLRQASRQIADGRYDEVLPSLGALISERAGDAEPYDLQALVLARLRRYDEAVQVLEKGLRAVAKPHDLYRRLAQVLASKGDAVGMRQAIERVKESGSFSPTDLARTYRLLATLELELGNDHRAFSALQDAHGLDPNLRSLKMAAELAVKIGQPGFAVRAWQELCEARSGENEYCTLREKLLRKYGYVP